MSTNRYPFHRREQLNLDKLYAAAYRLPYRMDANLKSLIKQLLMINEEDRLGALNIKHLKNHEFYQTLNWHLLKERKLRPPLGIMFSHETGCFGLNNFDQKKLRRKVELGRKPISVKENWPGFSYNCIQTPAALAFKIGDRVRVTSQWLSRFLIGTVKTTNPLRVQPDDFNVLCTWDFVEHLSLKMNSDAIKELNQMTSITRQKNSLANVEYDRLLTLNRVWIQYFEETMPAEILAIIYSYGILLTREDTISVKGNYEIGLISANCFDGPAIVNINEKLNLVDRNDLLWNELIFE